MVLEWLKCVVVWYNTSNTNIQGLEKVKKYNNSSIIKDIWWNTLSYAVMA